MKVKGTQGMIKNLGGFISKNSPTILTFLAVGGIATTVASAIRSTPTAMVLIDDAEELVNQDATSAEDCRSLTKMEVIKATYKVYLPTIGLGVVTSLCIIGANTINSKRNAALASVYGITEAAFREYQNKIIETIGKNKEQQVRDDINKDQLVKNPISKNEVIFTGKGEVLCYDSLSGRYFKSDIETLRQAINQLNKDFLSDMWISLNDLYYAIGISGTKLGDELGWDLDQGLLDVTFSSQLSEENEPCLVLNYKVSPKRIS